MVISIHSHITIFLLTRSTPLHLFRCDREDVQNFNHYLDDDIGHRVCWWHFRIGFESFEEVLDPIEEIDKGFFTGADVLGSLADFGIKNASKKTIWGDPHQEENTDTSRDDICRWEYL